MVSMSFYKMASLDDASKKVVDEIIREKGCAPDIVYDEAVVQLNIEGGTDTGNSRKIVLWDYIKKAMSQIKDVG